MDGHRNCAHATRSSARQQVAYSSLGYAIAGAVLERTGGYALGWAQVTVDWAPAPVVTDSGSNDMNLAIAMFWPETDFGSVMMTNIAGTATDQALLRLAADLYESYAGEPSP